MSSAVFTEVVAPSTAVCWKCLGSKVKVVRAASPVPGQNTTSEVTCPICNGTGVIARTRTARKRGKDRSGITAPPVGPIPLGSPEPSTEEELSFLTGQWLIYQRVDKNEGLRYSTDDVVTAWTAWRCGRALLQSVGRMALADIGCGIGSVLLMSAWLHPGARLVGIEAQAARAAMARRSAAFNLGPGSDRVTVVGGDLRDPATLSHALAAVTPSRKTEAAAAAAPTSAPDAAALLFDIVTGTPPYFDVGNGVASGGLPGSEETARCLFRYRGGMEAYCGAAARAMARPHGLFVVVETALALERSYASAAAAGLRVLARLDVVPKVGKPPLINVFVMCHADAPYQPRGFEEAALVKGDGSDVQIVEPGSADGASSAASSSSASASTNAALAATSSSVIDVTSDMLFAPLGISPYGEDPAVWERVSIDGGYVPPAATAAAEAAASSSSSSASTIDGSYSAVASASSSLSQPGDSAPTDPPPRKRVRRQHPRPYPGSRHGEIVHVITVRGEDDARTPEYVSLLHDLGKPG